MEDAPAKNETPLIDEQAARELAGHDVEAIGALLAVVVAPDSQQTTVQSALCRTVALAHVLHAPGIGEKSLTELAQALGVTRALLSSYCVRLRDFAGLDCRAGRRATARENMRQGQLKSYELRKQSKHD